MPGAQTAALEGTWALRNGGSRLTDEEYSDDEDVSWKVRRAAAKCLATISSAYPDRFTDIYAQACPALLARFREREESVKIDVFQAFIALLRQVPPAPAGVPGHGVLSLLASSKGMELQLMKARSGISQRAVAERAHRQPAVYGMISVQLVGAQASSAARREGSGPAAAAKQKLRSDVPAIAKAVARQLREKSVKARATSFALLRALVAVQPGATNDACALLLPGVLAALSVSPPSVPAVTCRAAQAYETMFAESTMCRVFFTVAKSAYAA